MTEWRKVDAVDPDNFDPVHFSVEDGIVLVASDAFGQPNVEEGMVVMELAQFRYIAVSTLTARGQ